MRWGRGEPPNENGKIAAPAGNARINLLVRCDQMSHPCPAATRRTGARGRTRYHVHGLFVLVESWKFSLCSCYGPSRCGEAAGVAPPASPARRRPSSSTSGAIWIFELYYSDALDQGYKMTPSTVSS